ncbi:PAAR domain-containing protein [Stenotrophomonas maltophilia]|uniref:PAAR domain-containing protein n=1 Tax=Stenotrophomonas maltophilia TaxID=40324 RepID=UPI0039C3E2D9
MRLPLLPILLRILQQHRSARMARLFIVVGNRLSSGGSVLTGSPFTDIEGRPMARAGDRTTCPAHGPGTIITGDATMIVDGNAAARHGDRASCGCSLIAGRQNLVFEDQGIASASNAPAPPTASTRQAGATPNIPAESPDRTSTLRSRRRASVCWADDHEMEVATNAHGRYYLVHDENGTPLDLSLQRKFKILVPLRSTGDVEVLVRIKATAGRNIECSVR